MSNQGFQFPRAKRLPFRQALSAWWLTRQARCKVAHPHFYNIAWNEELQAVEVTFFAPRCPVRIYFTFGTGKPFTVEAYSYADGDRWVELPAGISYSAPKDTILAAISLAEARLSRRIRFVVKEAPESFRYTVNIVLAKTYYPDENILEKGKEAYDRNDYAAARSHLEEYCDLAPGNPHALHWLSFSLARLKELDRAEDCAIRVSANGHFDHGLSLYRHIQDIRPYLQVADLRQMQNECRDWDIGRHHGVVSLLKQTELSLGLDGWYVRKYHGVWEVRRDLAGRVLTRLDFGFTNRDILLKTLCRVIHKNDSIEVLSKDKFSQSDSPARTIFIEDRIDLQGSWMLPDLETGDLLDWSYEIAYRERPPINGRPHFVSNSSLFEAYMPTQKAVVSVRAPKGMEVSFASLNGAPGMVNTSPENDRYQTYGCEGRRYNPVRETGCPYENITFNPTVACSGGRHTWKEVADQTLNTQLGANSDDGDFPDLLQQIIGECHDPYVALERAFYWVRDKLKYGSFKSSEAKIASSGRLAAIVESGFGDCKDCAFVLRQVGRRLGIPSYYLLVNMDSGVVVDSLPADAFDHVFTACRKGDKWLYLDASGSSGVFGLPPEIAQGMMGLIECDTAQLIKLPEDEPDSNTVCITEIFDRVEDDWLGGTFRVEAFGRCARSVDEAWKIASLRQYDQAHIIMMALAEWMPGIMPQEAERTSHTGNSNRFAANGRHRRCQLSSLDGAMVGTLSWNNDSLPLRAWRFMYANRFARFRYPLRLVFECTITGAVLDRLVSISSPPAYSNDLCDVHGSLKRSDGSATYSVTVTVKRQSVSLDQQCHVPPAMEHIEKARRLAMVIRP